jgi:hypothetical protein
MNLKGKKSHFVATLEFCIWGVAKFAYTLVQIHFGYGWEIVLYILVISLLCHNMILQDGCNENLNNFELDKDTQIKCRLFFVNLRQGTHIKID